MQSGVTGAV